MSRLGQPYCPACELPVGTQSADEVIEKIMDHPPGTKLYLMAPLEIQRGRAVRDALAGEPRGRLRAASASMARPIRSISRRKSTAGGSIASRWWWIE